MVNKKVFYVFAIALVIIGNIGLFFFFSRSIVVQEKAQIKLQTQAVDRTIVDCSESKDSGCFLNRMKGCLPVTVKMIAVDKSVIDVTILGVENDTCHFQQKIDDVLTLDCHFPKGILDENILKQTMYNKDIGWKKIVDDACPPDVSTNTSVEKVALLSFTEFGCDWGSNEAFFEFAYQENGKIKWAKTRTTCDDLKKVGASNDAIKNPTLIGEKITLHYTMGRLIGITRENGETYQAENGEQTRNFFHTVFEKTNLHDANGQIIPGNYCGGACDDIRLLKNSNSDQVVSECLMIKESRLHDNCLWYQAGLQKDTTICDKMAIVSDQDVCRQWVDYIKQNK